MKSQIYLASSPFEGKPEPVPRAIAGNRQHPKFNLSVI